MQAPGNTQHAAVAIKKRHGKHKLPVNERLAITPGEFAAAFGKSETWGYRQLYSGRVKAMQISGRLLIPKSEVDRLLSEAAIYNDCSTRSPKKASKSRGNRMPTNGNCTEI